ncbi:dystrophin-like [Liolophura sinensis]|uniref:dystrophin-like n=1 Tax=Liolophura sinensis TaxID=3198878 RepID=UPI0031593A94
MFPRTLDEIYDVIVKGWERTEQSNGVPYYLNHKTERTSWDHPYYDKLMTELREMDNIKYAAYRTAMKLRHLQKRLRLHQVLLVTASKVLTQHGYQDSVDAIIDCDELKLLLTQLYSNVSELSQSDVLVYAELLQNFLLNAYDVQRRGRISVLSLKVALGCLCNARLSEKYKFFYRQLCDSSFFISSKMLGSFLQNALQLAEVVHERKAFGGNNVAPAVNSCIRLSGQGPGVSEDSFLTWLNREPQTLVWLPTLHRVAVSESAKHHAKCSVCKACPILGFRYRCLLCFSFDICQQCFLVGRTGKGHKLKHPIQEYCLPTSSREEAIAFMKTVRNQLSKKHREKTKPKYLPIDSNDLSDVDMNRSFGGILQDSTVQNKAHYIQTHQKYGHKPTNPSSSNRLPSSGSQFNRKVLQELKLQNESKENASHRNELALKDGNQLSVSVENPINLEQLIGELETENRFLYECLAEVSQRESSDTESNASLTEALEDEKEVLEAKNEVLEHHNSVLNHELIRLRNSLKMSPWLKRRLAQDKSDVLVKGQGRNNSLFQHQLTSPTDVFSVDQTDLADGSPVTIGDLCTPGADVHAYPHRQDLGHSPGLASIGMVNNTLTDVGQTSSDRLPLAWDSVDNIDITTDTAQFTLPSYSQSHNCPDAERELDSMVQQIITAFPSNISQSSQFGLSRLLGSSPDVLGVADRVGVALSEFVTAVSDPQAK